MNEKMISQYCKQVGKKLVCDRLQKKQLLAGLEQELLEKGYSKTVTWEQLIEQVGLPSAVAEQLQETISPEERAKAQKKNSLRPAILAAIIIFAAITAVFCYINYIQKHSIEYRTEEVIEEPLPLEDSDFIWVTD